MVRRVLAALVVAALTITAGAEGAAAQGTSAHVYVPRGDRLVIKPRQLGLGAHTLLEGLRWQRWGSAATTARGILDYADATTTFRAPIHVRLSRLGACGAKRTYLRQTITFDRAADRRRWGALDGATTLVCPAP
jgi:hypothetical protein